MDVRSFSEGDEEAVVGLWNRRVTGCFATGPLSADVFVTDVMGKRYFDPAGLILAFEGARPVAFAHAGFKSSDWLVPDPRLGTVSMIAVEEGRPDAGEAVVSEAIRYLLRRGARQIEAFTIDFPNTPFYNGLYGGEKAGMDEEHPGGLELMRRCRFQITSGAVVMRCELEGEIAGTAALEGLDLQVGPWDCPLKGRDPLECYGIPEAIRRASLMDADGRDVGGVSFWHLERHNRASGDRLAAVTHVGVAEELRGTGVAQVLMREVHRILRSEGARRVCLGSAAANGRAVSFYRKLGYRPVTAAYVLHLDWRRYGDYV